MVSEKAVVVLMIVAIVLSVVSVTTTFLSLNMKTHPAVQIIQGNTEDAGQAKVSIIIMPPSEPPITEKNE